MTIELDHPKEVDSIKPAVLQTRTKTERILIHHTAMDADVTMEQINQSHINRGFSMIGYHRFIEKDGKVKQGRPDSAVGAHAIGANYDSIAVCLAGNFEVSIPTDAQIQSLVALIKRIRRLYGNVPYEGHSSVDPVNHPTACPGKLFPWAVLKQELEGTELPEVKVLIKDKVIIGKLIDNRTYVPVAEIIKALNNEVIWDEKDRTVTIK